MKQTGISLIAALVIIGAFAPAQAANLKDQVKVEIDSMGLHPGLAPGMYVCASSHLHIKASVANLASLALGKIKVAGEAYGPDRALLGKATASTKKPVLLPGEKAEVNLEFLTITGPTIEQVTGAELTVIEAPAM
ncbi:MAG: hypothetical protein IH878_12590 [Gemmatimonadetes bacterium]|jgi:hypothetical protein|nr:hypothetical protein [Gemmatimonadota bacterium]